MATTGEILPWSAPVWPAGYDPDRYFHSTGGFLHWLDDAKTRALAVYSVGLWHDAAEKANYGPSHNWIGACVITLTGDAVSMGPQTQLGRKDGAVGFVYPVDSVGDLGDGYFVTGATWYNDDGSDGHITMTLFRVVGDTVTEVSTTRVIEGLDYNTVGSGLLLAQTANPNRVMMSYAVRRPYPDAPIRHCATVTRSGTTLTTENATSIVAPGRSALWTNASRTMGYFGGSEQTGVEGTPIGQLFTLSPDGTPTYLAASNYGDIPMWLVEGYWTSGPADNQFVATWNGTTLGAEAYGIFDEVIVQVDPTANTMTVVDRAGPIQGVNGNGGDRNRWIGSAVMPDGKITLIAANLDSTGNNNRLAVIHDPFGTQVGGGGVPFGQTTDGSLPYDSGWEPYAEVRYNLGHHQIANSTGVLVMVQAEMYYSLTTTGAGSNGCAVAFVRCGAPTTISGQVGDTRRRFT